MPTKEKTKEKEFGFIITQGISRKMTKAKLAEKFCNFLAEQKKELSKALMVPADRIHTNCYYDCDSREYKGMFRIQFSDFLSAPGASPA